MTTHNVVTAVLPLPAWMGMMVADRSERSTLRAEVHAARGGDSAAFETLVRSVQRPVFGLCMRLLRSEAEASEVAQETFLRAFQNLHRFDDGKPFDLWVMAIARNLCLDLLRRRSRMRTQDVEELTDQLPATQATQEETVIAQEERHSLESAMGTLSADDRAVLALYYVQKRTTKEIAVVLGCAPGTIMARLFRAREKLRKKMKPQEDTP